MDACDYVLSCQALNVTASRGPGSGSAYPILKAPGCSRRGPGVCRAGRMRIYSGQIGGEIPPISRYRDGREDWYELILGLFLFRLVAPPLQPGVVGLYLVRGAWFPSHLSLEGIGRIQIFGP
jgi:hypothetical protein